MPNPMPPQTFFIDRAESPVGTMLLIHDPEERVRALDFHDFEGRMRRLLRRHYGEDGNDFVKSRETPAAIRRALAGYFAGDLTAIGAPEKTTVMHLGKATTPRRCRIFLSSGICRPNGARSPLSASPEGDRLMMRWRGCYSSCLKNTGWEAAWKTDAAVSSSNIVRLKSTGVRVVCLSYLDLGSSAAHLRHSIKRIRRQIADATLVVGLWGLADGENREQLQTTTAADYYVSSLREALSLCIDAASGGLAKFPTMRDAKAGATATISKLVEAGERRDT